MRRVTFLIFMLVLCAMPTDALALERETLARPDDPTGLLITSPSRIEHDIEPGVRTTFTLEVYNDDTVPIDVSLIPYDLGPSADPTGIASRAEESEFGAKDWIEFEQPNLRLQPFERVEVEVYLDPPATAPVGTNFGAVAVRGGPASGDVGTHDDSSVLQIDALVQLFLTVPGEIEHDLSIVGVKVKDTLLLGSTRLSIIEATFRNQGNVNEHVNGTLQLTSIFGNTAHEFKIDDFIVIRGDTRTRRFVWRDMPRVGAFTPVVEATGNAGEELSARGGRIVILPWWIPVLIIIVLVVPPLFVWWRRRNDWMQYLDEDDSDEWSDSEPIGS